MKLGVALTFAILTLVLLALVSVAAAQKRFITSTEYYDIAYKGDAKWWERNHRVESIEERFADGMVKSSKQRVIEQIMPDRSREYLKTVEGGITTEREVITIANTEYSRDNNGPWTKRILPSSGRGTGSGSGNGSSRVVYQYSIEPATIDGVAVNLIEALTIYGTGDRLTFTEVKKWRTDDGTPYKEEHSEGYYSPRVETYHKTTTTEYDPKVTIEAPMK